MNDLPELELSPLDPRPAQADSAAECPPPFHEVSAAAYYLALVDELRKRGFSPRDAGECAVQVVDVLLQRIQ